MLLLKSKEKHIQIYNCWYFSRLQVCIGIVALTFVCSEVLTGHVDFNVLMIVSLGAAIFYWLDDIIDAAQDEIIHQVLIGTRKIRLLAYALFILTAFIFLVQFDTNLSSVLFLFIASIFTVIFISCSPIKNIYIHLKNGIYIKYFLNLSCGHRLLP